MRWIVRDGKLYAAEVKSRMARAITIARLRREVAGLESAAEPPVDAAAAAKDGADLRKQ